MEQSLNLLGISGIKYYEPNMSQPEHTERHWQVIQKIIGKHLEMYLPDITEEKKFCIQNTQKVLGKKYINPPLVTKGFLSVLLNYANKNHFGQMC